MSQPCHNLMQTMGGFLPPKVSRKNLLSVIPAEDGIKTVYEQLQAQSIPGNLLAGTSSFHCLDLASMLVGVRGVLILDNSTHEEAFWQNVFEIMKTSDTREQTIEKLKSLIKEKGSEWFKFKNLDQKKNEFQSFSNQYQDTAAKVTKTLRHLDRAISTGSSWLSTDERWEKIHSIFKEKNFAFIRLDFTDAYQMSPLKNTLNNKGWTIRALYVAHAYTGLQEIAQTSFETGVTDLVGKQTPIIYSKLPESGSMTKVDGYVQNIFCLKDDSFERIYGASLQTKSKIDTKRLAQFLGSLEEEESEGSSSCDEDPQPRSVFLAGLETSSEEECSSSEESEGENEVSD